MKRIKRLSVFLLIGLLIFSLFAPACGATVAETKEKSAQAIDAYMQEIRDMDLEYSWLFIEREAEQGKQAIMQAEDKTEIRKIKKDTLKAMKALVLTDEEALAIKQAFLEYDTRWGRATLRADFGRYRESYVAIMLNNVSIIDLGRIRIGDYTFYCTIGYINVYTKDGALSLEDAYATGVINDQELAKIYEDNDYMTDRERVFEYNKE